MIKEVIQMVNSQNGWLANDRSVITTYTIGDKTRVALRSGDAGYLLQRAANWFDKNIRDLDYNYNNGALDDWGYAERAIRGGVELSNHASGTALDINATKWPLGSDETIYLTPQEIARWHAHLAEYEGVLRWGGDYIGRQDPMHLEINSSAAEVARVAAKLRNTAVAAPAVPKAAPPKPSIPPFPLPAGDYFGLITGPNQSHGGFSASERIWVKAIQQRLIKKGYVPGVTDINSGWADGVFEQATADAVTRFQKKEMPGTTFFGQVWSDDWRKLFS